MALTREQEQGGSGRAEEVNVTVTAQFEGKVGETRLRGFRCVQRGENSGLGEQSMVNMELPSRGKEADHRCSERDLHGVDVTRRC